MSIFESYTFFNKLIKQMQEITSLYNNLKLDINKMDMRQIRMQTSKILHRISKIDENVIDYYIDQARGYPKQSTFKQIAKETLDKIKEIKDFIYSLKSEQFSPKEQEIEEDKITPLDKKLDYIRDKYDFLQKELDTTDTATIIRDAKRLESVLSRLNFEDLPKDDYDEMVNIKSEVSKMIKTLQGVQKSEEYGPYIYAPLVQMILNTFTSNKEEAEAKAATLLDFIEDPSRIHMFETAIKRIIAKKMTQKEFRIFYKSVMLMMRSERKFESFKDYKDRYEQIYLI